jgi:hypothetical protein
MRRQLHVVLGSASTPAMRWLLDAEQMVGLLLSQSRVLLVYSANAWGLKHVWRAITFASAPLAEGVYVMQFLWVQHKVILL